MTTFNLKAPSKTFLVGEYAVLAGGTALVLSTPPYFQLTVHTTTTTVLPNPFHPESPAAKLIQREPLLQSAQYEFYDPHQQQGGFGASSAQFLLLYQFLQHQIHHDFKSLNLLQLKQTYQQCASYGSGADVLAQAQGLLSAVQPTQVQSWDWPFKDLAYVLIRTGNKVATHTHLSTLTSIDCTTLHAIVDDTLRAYQAQRVEDFCAAVNQYAAALETLQLVAPRTQELIAFFKQQAIVRAVKGCGALGADVILLLIAPDDLAQMKILLQQHHLSLVCAGVCLAQGSQAQQNLLRDDNDKCK